MEKIMKQLSLLDLEQVSKMLLLSVVCHFVKTQKIYGQKFLRICYKGKLIIVLETIKKVYSIFFHFLIFKNGFGLILMLGAARLNSK